MVAIKPNGPTVLTNPGELQMDIRIANRFKVQKRIGSGSFGRIYQGVDLMTHEKVAIKIVML